MSSAEEDHSVSPPPTGTKKRRILRACDICRRKKIRCDSAGIPGEKCTNCLAFNSECTHAEPAKKRGPKGHIDVLQQRVNKMESLLQKLRPGADINEELDHVDDQDVAAGALGAVASSSLQRDAATMLHLSRFNRDDLDDEELAHYSLIANMQHLAIDCDQERFFGMSSGFMFARKAMDVKKHLTNTGDNVPLARTEVWRVHPWELATADIPPPQYIFPEDDLIAHLTQIYFEELNIYMPILHRPTFEKAVADGLHHRDHYFGAVVLTLCAVAARNSDDPRTIMEGTNSKHSSGWQWFSQVQILRRSLMRTASLHELQYYCLAAYYVQGSSTPQAVWTVVGLGLRFAQEKGIHRRKLSNHQWTVEDELYKRAFWVLLAIDRMICSFLGRPCSVHDEDYDLELPIECDDEYWEHPDPTKAWKQPPGKPSYVAYFNSMLKLYDILGFALRTIYSVNAFKASLGETSQQWEANVVAKLDSALNRWVDFVPDHLRWDPARENKIFFYQSSSLFITYYYVQIQIHRPFIPSFGASSSLSFPSLAICANAARSCSHVVDIQNGRGPMAQAPMQMAVFCAGIVLLMNIWSGKRSGLSTDPTKEMADAHKCMAYLKWCERRWHISGRFLDMLCQLAYMGDLPLPPSPPTNPQKRDRMSHSVDVDASSSPASSTSDASAEEPRLIAGSQRIRADPKSSEQLRHPRASSSSSSTGGGQHSSGHQRQQPPPVPPISQQQSSLRHQRSTTRLHAAGQPPQQQQQQHPSSVPQPPLAHASTAISHLPIYTEQLGRLPVHGQIDFTQFQEPAYSQWPTTPFGSTSAETSTPNNNQQPSGALYGDGNIDCTFYHNVVATFSGQTAQEPMNQGYMPQNGIHPNGSGGIAHTNGNVVDQNGYASTPTAAIGDPNNMWASAPIKFNLDDWSAFIENGGRDPQSTNGYPLRY